MERKVVFFDVDGTLTSNHGDVSEPVKEAIASLRRKGHLAFICTGRSWTGVQSLLEIGFDGVICSAGGYVKVGDQLIYEASLDPQEVQLARDVFERNHVLYNLETNEVTFQSQTMNELFVSQQNLEQSNSEMQRLLREQQEQFNIQDLSNYDAHPLPVQKMCFICQTMDQLEEPKQVLSDRFHFVIHDIFSKDMLNGEIISKACNKGHGVSRVMDYLGEPLANSIGYGDSMNDYEMMETCGYAVAMGNASAVLKKCADEICESVEEDGVYHSLKRLGLC